MYFKDVNHYFNKLLFPTCLTDLSQFSSFQTNSVVPHFQVSNFPIRTNLLQFYHFLTNCLQHPSLPPLVPVSSNLVLYCEPRCSSFLHNVHMTTQSTSTHYHHQKEDPDHYQITI